MKRPVGLALLLTAALMWVAEPPDTPSPQQAVRTQEMSPSPPPQVQPSPAPTSEMPPRIASLVARVERLLQPATPE